MTHTLTAGDTYRDAHGRPFTPTPCQDGDASPGHVLSAMCFDVSRAYSTPMCQPLPTPADASPDAAPAGDAAPLRRPRKASSKAPKASPKASAGARRCVGLPDDATPCDAPATSRMRQDGGQVPVCESCRKARAAGAVSRVPVCQGCGKASSDIRRVRAAGDAATRARLCESCRDAVSVARGIVAAREADGDAAIGAVAARETRIAAWDALAADTRRLMLDAADSVAWECLASLPADAVSVSPEIWDAASDALRDAVRVRVASAPLPVWAVSDDGRRAWPDADADAGAAREHVRAVLSAGVEWRDTSGQTRGPNGNHLPIREAGRVPLSRLWGEYVSKARLALSREARRASAVSLDRTDDAGNLILRTPKAVIGVRQSSRATGTLTVPPGEVWELPTLALPVRVGAGVAWRVVERDSWDAAGVRVGALRLMTRADRTRLAEIILSRQDVEPARAGAPTRVERDAADDARRVIGAYRRACVWHEAGQTDTESLDAADGATPTARQARQARDAVTVTASAGYARTRQDRTARQARQAGQTRAVAFAYAVARRERLAGMRAASAVVAGLPLSVLAPLSR